MATTQKALSMAQDLVSELQYRQSALAVALSFDTDGSPLVKVGTGANGAKGALIKIAPISWPLAKDVLGLDAQMFHPHVVKVNLEANYAGTSDNVADVNDWATLLLVLGTTLARGARTEVYLSSNGTAPNATDINDSTKLVAAFEPNAQFPMLSSQ